jgi:hypothetical protein
MEDFHVIQALDILRKLHEFDETPEIKMYAAFKHLVTLRRPDTQALVGVLMPTPPTPQLPVALALFVSNHLVAVQSDASREVIEGELKGELKAAQGFVIYPGNGLGGVILPKSLSEMRTGWLAVLITSKPYLTGLIWMNKRPQPKRPRQTNRALAFDLGAMIQCAIIARTSRVHPSVHPRCSSRRSQGRLAMGAHLAPLLIEMC